MLVALAVVVGVPALVLLGCLAATMLRTVMESSAHHDDEYQ
jgi:hypothetical protein